MRIILGTLALTAAVFLLAPPAGADTLTLVDGWSFTGADPLTGVNGRAFVPQGPQGSSSVTNGSFEFAETNNAGGGAAIALAGVPAMPIGDYTVVLGGFTADSLQDSWGSLLNVGDTPNDYGIYVRKTTDASGKSMNTLFFYGYSGTGASGGSLVEDQRYDIIVSRASSGRIRAWLDGVQVIEVLDTYGFFGIAGSLFFGRDDAGENITAGQLEYIKIYSGGLTTYDAGLLGEPTAAAPEPSALALLAAALASPALYRRRRAS